MADPKGGAAKWADKMGAPPCDCPPHVGPCHGASCPRVKWLNNEGILLQCGLPKRDEREMLIQKVADLEHLIGESDKTVAWVNRARPVIQELMLAYERRIRSLCSGPEEIAKEPWRCAEYLAAETLLAEQPTWVVTAAAAANPNNDGSSG